jgi:hypothetical protein
MIAVYSSFRAIRGVYSGIGGGHEMQVIQCSGKSFRCITFIGISDGKKPASSRLIPSALEGARLNVFPCCLVESSVVPEEGSCERLQPACR